MIYSYTRDLRARRLRWAIHQLGLTRAAWAVVFALALLLGGCTSWALAPIHAEEVERYQPSARGGRQAVEELAAEHFPPHRIAWVVRTARCESGYDLYAHTSGFDPRWFPGHPNGVSYDFWGALQVDAVTWAGKAWELFEGPLSEPSVNFAMAAWIVERYGPSHWPVCGR